MLYFYVMKFVIYTLSDPRTNIVKYVGCTSNLKKRMWGHRASKYKNNVSIWVKELSYCGVRPYVDVIDIIDQKDVVEKEKFYIWQFSQKFELLNMNAGGGGTVYGRISGEKNPMFGVRLRGESNPFYGKKHSEETIQILREKCGHTGIDKVWNKGKTGVYSQELIQKMKSNQPNLKPIVVNDMDGNILYSFIGKNECCKVLGIDFKQLSYVLDKKKSGPIYKGMIFEYDNK